MDQIPQWFQGCRFNFAENILYRAAVDENKTALLVLDEMQRECRISFKELRQQVMFCANGLRKLGVGIGDRVAGYCANCPHAVVMMLAVASLGAIWSCTSADFGSSSVLERFIQIEPKVLFSVNAVYYNGKVHDHLEKLKNVVNGLPSIEIVILVPWIEGYSCAIDGVKSILYDNFLSQSSDVKELVFESLPFNHPLYILYSSGTTGKPKCLVHSAGGTLLQHLKEHCLHGDLNMNDIVFYYTTTGWMMWNWLISVLAIGSTVVLYDGSPLRPKILSLFELAAKHRFTVFGTSAKYLQTLEESNNLDFSKIDLSSLHSIYSTGSPLSPTTFEFVYGSIKKHLLLGSITGGTDIVSLFCGHNVCLPVFKGEIQCRCLGMAVEAWDDEGHPIEGLGGELVCTKPFPCMPLYFWNDSDGSRYHSSYFNKYKNVWSHGDFICINPTTKGITMLGRSDATLNPGGVRFGSSDIYQCIAKLPFIKDSLVVGQKRVTDKDEKVILFVITERELDNQMKNEINDCIRSLLSAKHVPWLILRVPDIPYTLNGKKVEIAVKKIICGLGEPSTTSLANPECLEYYRNIPELYKTMNKL